MFWWFLFFLFFNAEHKKANFQHRKKTGPNLIFVFITNWKSSVTDELKIFSLSTMPPAEHKLCVFGSGGVGKSCLVRRRKLLKKRISFSSRRCNSSKAFLWLVTIQRLRMFIKKSLQFHDERWFRFSFLSGCWNRWTTIFVGNSRHGWNCQCKIQTNRTEKNLFF